jgi:endonuclease/exonuclease/phosphatase family metal-dependent hydrolase
MKNRRYLYVFTMVFLGLLLGATVILAQAEAGCPTGQTPQFHHGFALLKIQLGEVMGEPIECEHYDAEGNAFQQTTTGQASYLKRTNTPSFTSGNRHWAWTLQGLEYGTDEAQPPIVPTSPPLTPTHEIAAAMTSSFRIMSYNILYGGGITPEWEEKANQGVFPYPGNRLPAILEVIKAAEPDIVGLQEAAGWQQEPDPMVQQVAAELGMKQFLARTPSGLNLALLTRFQIVEAENLSDQVGNIGALRATIRTEAGQIVHVFVVHLDPFSAETREREITTLTGIMAPYLQAPTLMMGDLNMVCLKDPANCREYQLLSQAGWQLVVQEKYLVNQIWTSPLLSHSVKELTFPGGTFVISDHLPLGAVLEMQNAE